MPENSLNDIAVVDEGGNAQGGGAVAALERVDLVNFLDQPGPVGFAAGVDGHVVDNRARCRVAGLLRQFSGAARAAIPDSPRTSGAVGLLYDSCSE